MGPLTRYGHAVPVPPSLGVVEAHFLHKALPQAQGHWTGPCGFLEFGASRCIKTISGQPDVDLDAGHTPRRGCHVLRDRGIQGS